MCPMCEARVNAAAFEACGVFSVYNPVLLWYNIGNTLLLRRKGYETRA